MNKRTRKPINKNFLSGSENSESEEDSKVSNTDDDLYDNEMTSDDSKPKSKRVPKTKSIIITIPTKTKPPATLKLKAMPMIPRKQPAKPNAITTTTTRTTNSMLSDQSDDGGVSKDEEEDVDIGNDSGNDGYSGNEEEDDDLSDISEDEDQDDDDDEDEEDQRASKKKKTTVTKSTPVTKKSLPKIIIKGTIPKKQAATTPTTTTTTGTSTNTSPTLSPPPQASPALLKKKPGRKKLVQTESQTESNRGENDLPFKNNNFSFPIENQKKPYKSIKQILALEPIPTSPMFPTWQNIEVSQTCQPIKKYCDITGLQSNYVDPISTLRYYDSSVFQLIRSFTDNVRQSYLQLRKSGFR